MKKTLLFIAGWLALIVGFIGILLPVMPTTPFVVLAAVCFSYSSPRFYNLLRKAPYFGPYIENYRTKQGVPLKSKLLILVFVWAGISVSTFLIAKLWATITLSVIGLAITIHILWLKTRRENSNTHDATGQQHDPPAPKE